MRTPSLSLGTIGILAAGLIAPSLQAQTSSATPVIGYYKTTAKAGINTFVNGFVAKKEFQGQSTSITAGTNSSVINQTGATFGAFNLHYVELLDDPSTPTVESYAGVIVDITSNTATAITVNANLAQYGQNLRYAVRKHATLGTVLPAAAGPQDFDTVVLITNSGEKAYSYEAGTWYDGSTPANNTIVYPGQGFAYNAGVDTLLTIGGNEVSYVKEGVTQAPIYPGIANLVGPVNPLVGPSPSNPAVTNTYTPTSANLGSGVQDFDTVVVYSSNGLGQASNLTYEGGHFTDDFAANADNFPIPVGSSVFVNAGLAGIVKLPPVTVAP